MNFYIVNLQDKQTDVQTHQVKLWKKYSFSIVLFFILSATIFKVLYLQVIKYPQNVSAANKNYSRGNYILPERGVIYSSDLKPLVQNKPVYSLVIDLNQVDRYTQYKSFNDLIPSEYKSLLEKYKIVIMDTNIDQFNTDLKLGRDYFELSNFYSQKDFTAISTDFNNVSNSKLLKITPTSYRDYTQGEPFSHLLGYTSFVSESDLQNDPWYTPNAKIGVMGLESYYEDYLRGIKGTTTNLFSAKSNVIDTKVIQDPIPGNSLVTTLDSNLQKAAFTALKKMVDDNKSKGGAVVVQNPSTGEVLALVSYPSFDNNLFSKGIDQGKYNEYLQDPNKPMLNRAIASAFPPGSTFKIVTAVAGLQENSLTPQTTINDTGVINIGSFAYKTWKAGGHGVVNVEDALKESSDIFFYVVAGGHQSYPQIKGLGPYKMYNWTSAFNFGKNTNIDLTGEQPGFVPNPQWKKQVLNEPWYVGNSYHFGIGQGYLTSTPLQVNTMTNSIANGGKILQPYIVSKIVDTQTNDVVLQNNPLVIEHLPISSSTLNAIRQGLLKATSPGGTAYPLFNYKVIVAGKTGTSEYGAKNKDGTYPTHAWYTSYAPFDNPQISVTVFIEDGGGGSDNAVPVAKAVYDEYFKNIETSKQPTSSTKRP